MTHIGCHVDDDSVVRNIGITVAHQNMSDVDCSKSNRAIYAIGSFRKDASGYLFWGFCKILQNASRCEQFRIDFGSVVLERIGAAVLMYDGPLDSR